MTMAVKSIIKNGRTWSREDHLWTILTGHSVTTEKEMVGWYHTIAPYIYVDVCGLHANCCCVKGVQHNIGVQEHSILSIWGYIINFSRETKHFVETRFHITQGSTFWNIYSLTDWFNAWPWDVQELPPSTIFACDRIDSTSRCNKPHTKCIGNATGWQECNECDMKPFRTGGTDVENEPTSATLRSNSPRDYYVIGFENPYRHTSKHFSGSRIPNVQKSRT